MRKLLAMKIFSWNVNGLRAVYRKGFLDWLSKSKADIVCLQEIKAQREQLPSALVNFREYHLYFNSATRKGYSGVLAYSRKEPLKIIKKLGLERFDGEGRLLQLQYRDFTLINLYLPQGGRQKENLAYKLAVYDFLLDYLKGIKDQEVIIAGDFNVAHKEVDLARPRQNKNNTMFTPAERKQIDRLLKLGFTDTFRQFNKKGGHYTWWPYFYKARARNLGWRIDYAFASKKLAPKLKDALIFSEVKGSDHCPIGVELKS